LRNAAARVSYDDAILEGAFGGLCDDGAFFQFTYGVRCPVPERTLDRLDLHSTRIGFALRNLSPATVHRIRRRQSGHAGHA
jgi:phospholipid N-methyltransferase